MNKEDIIIRSKLKKDLTINQSYLNTIYTTFDKLPDKKKKSSFFYKYKLSIATACCSLFLITGIVFANEIQNFFTEKFASGETIAKAAKQGYIATSNSDYINSKVDIKKGTNLETLDNFDTSLKTKDFFINNNKLSIEFDVKFDNKINLYKNLNQRVIGNENYIDYENFGFLIFTDISILDEENRILYFYGNEDNFNKLCKEKNQNFKYEEYNKNYLNTASNSIITKIDPNTNTINLTCNFTTEFEFPKSKELKIHLNEISFVPKNQFYDKSNWIILSGDWLFNLEVPEMMVNSSKYYYELINSDTPNFKLDEAKLTNTGLDISLIISNVENPVFPKELSEKEQEYLNTHNDGIVINTKDDFVKIYGDDPKNEELYLQYYKKLRVINPTGYPGLNWIKRTDGCYALDSNGKKYDYAYGQNHFHQKTGFINESTYYYNGTFAMTQYDATDEIYVILDFLGNPAKLHLKRIKN